MKIRGYDITEKRVAAACAAMLLVVSLLAAIKQANAADTMANLLDNKESQKTSKPTEQKLKTKPDNDLPQQFVPQKNNNNTNTDTEKKTTDTNMQNNKVNDTGKKNTADTKDKNRVTQQPANTPKTKPDSYTYVVQEGDSYSIIVRRAISEHGGSSLSSAQKIAAEAKLVEQAGWPEVDAGQSVRIDSTALSQAISSARSMTADEQQMWQSYADDIVW